MEEIKLSSFEAEIHIIGINPFVFVPEIQLKCLFQQAGKDKGKIPVKIKIDGHDFKQTLVKYAGNWRLYLNTPMRKAAGKDVGELATFEVMFDSIERTIEMPPKLIEALEECTAAKVVFEQLAPYLQKEIIRYIANLKTEDSIDRNVKRAIQFLLGKERFIGRDHP
ncbi:YdeI/OmpD-associated family protein [Pedobacter rhodius]|uniref:YdeI/OmpD-associated family protein n=1 Tax=Pedobacter rhodius TaxID=3004098 RepID=A0ABT4KTN5_9SPHI|nr:YdeI/OmpD-associated family protein [Pedobacter sp. SJ11]MCZ4222304.1 YdeI/OmpD-associated family protein [Pedobacter sp. SJ11]